MLRRAATSLARRAAAVASECSSSSSPSCAPSTSSTSTSCARQQLQQLQHQQRRGAHDLHVKHNKHVEQWMSRREDFEQEFAWDARRTVAAVALVVGVPCAIYSALVGQAHEDDRFAGRSERDFLWGKGGGGKA
jgi:ElaB/YqjD/DUF883 family membrane-anchored ribosome-binding protein